MNEKEFLVVMTKLAVAYDRDLKDEKIDLFQQNLIDEDFQTVLEAVERWVRRDPRFPRLSELLDEIHPKDEWIFPEEDQPALEFGDLSDAAKSGTAKEACSIIFGLCDKTITREEAAEKMRSLHDKIVTVPSWRLCAGLMMEGKRLK